MASGSTPKISVLIPTFNYARYLPEAIESVLGQDFCDFEVIVADDASTDETVKIAERYVKKDPRVRLVVHSPNRGMVENWNFCLKEARAPYIKFLFGDDRLCDIGALGKMLALLEAHPGATLAASARAILDENSKVVNIWRPLGNGLHSSKDIITRYLNENGKNLIGEPSAVLFRKADAERGFDPQYKQIVDVEMWFYLLERGDLVYTKEPLCAFRVHGRQQGEKNVRSGLGPQEHARFFSTYAMQPNFPREVTFPLLYPLRKKIALKRDPIFLEAEKRLIQKAGSGWRLPYYWYVFRHRVAKPFQNAIQSWQKRHFRKTFRLMP